MNIVNINCEGLSKSYSGKSIFRDLSFSLSSGQSMSIIGRNGSGKSTLIKLISNLVTSYKGKISIQVNQDAIQQNQWFQKIGLLSPYLNLYDELTGYENLEFFYDLRSNDTSHSKDRIDSLLQRVNLFERRDEPLKNYSSGMKQKLKLAFSLLHEPEILLFDEPRSNLDKEGVDLIHQISAEQKGKGILIIATNEEKDKELCDQTLNIEDFK
jgi:heme exporter protein A